MSYCVHCGVELADYEKNCPLCDTPVIDPRRGPAGEPLYGDRMDLHTPRLNRRFVVAMVALVLLIPFAVTTVLDLLYALGMSWSIYVLGAEALVWVAFLLPFLCPHGRPYWFLAADAAATALYLLLIALLSGSLRWYLPLALPLSLMAFLVPGLIVFIWRRRHLGRLARLGWSCMALALLPVGVDLCLTHWLSDRLMPDWSWYVSVPLLALGCGIVLLARSVRLTEAIRRRLFI